MKIGVISTLDRVAWGGSEELWAAMARAALCRGHTVSVCLLRPSANQPKLSSLEAAGAQLFCGPNWWFRARVLRRTDLVSPQLSTHLLDGLAPLKAFFASRPEVLLVNQAGDIPAIEFLRALHRTRKLQPYVILSQANWGKVPIDTVRYEAIRYYQDSRFALFVAQANLRTTERQLARELRNARVIKNPVNLNSLEPLDWPSESTVRFAAVARLDCVSKGQDILLEALSSDRWRSRNWRLSLFGVGTDERYLRELSVYCGIAEKVSFCGQAEDVRDIWRAHHALVLPSRHEGTPLAMVEAMLCGRPVIGCAVAGIPEWVSDENNGFLAEAATAESFAGALERAWRRRAEWREIGNAARDNALSRYDPSSGERLLEILLQAAGTNRQNFTLR